MLCIPLGIQWYAQRTLQSSCRTGGATPFVRFHIVSNLNGSDEINTPSGRDTKFFTLFFFVSSVSSWCYVLSLMAMRNSQLHTLKSQTLPDSLNGRFGKRLSSMIENHAVQFLCHQVNCVDVIVKNGRCIVQCFGLHKKHDAWAVKLV